MQKITPFLWFDNQAEEAADFYVAVFFRQDREFENKEHHTLRRSGCRGFRSTCRIGYDG